MAAARASASPSGTSRPVCPSLDDRTDAAGGRGHQRACPTPAPPSPHWAGRRRCRTDRAPTARRRRRPLPGWPPHRPGAGRREGRRSPRASVPRCGARTRRAGRRRRRAPAAAAGASARGARWRRSGTRSPSCGRSVPRRRRPARPGRAPHRARRRARASGSGRKRDGSTPYGTVAERSAGRAERKRTLPQVLAAGGDEAGAAEGPARRAADSAVAFGDEHVRAVQADHERAGGRRPRPPSRRPAPPSGRGPSSRRSAARRGRRYASRRDGQRRRGDGRASQALVGFERARVAEDVQAAERRVLEEVKGDARLRVGRAAIAGARAAPCARRGRARPARGRSAP